MSINKCIVPTYILENEKIKVGDKIDFNMPGFCSGNYTYEVIKDLESGRLILLNAPPKIFDGCISYTILNNIV